MVNDNEIVKSGTTTIAIMCKEGIVLCADMRVTSGYHVAYKKFEKIMKITDSIALTVAGTVSDVQLLVKLIRAELKLKAIRTKREPSVKESVNLLSTFVYHNIRKFSLIPGISHFIVGGIDETGFSIYDIGADGSITPCEEYCSSGSGSVYAYGVLESLYRPDMNLNDAVALGVKAVNAAVQRDIASGNGVNVITITKEGVKLTFRKELVGKLEV